MRDLLRSFIDFFSSLRLTVVLLAFSMVLVFAATLDQVNLGIWAVQEKYFRSLFVMVNWPGTRVPIPIFPGGYLVGGFLMLNLLAAFATRFRWGWAKLGLWMSHAGLILLLLGEFATGLLQRDYQMSLREGQTGYHIESFRDIELALIDTSHADHDEVVAIPADLLHRDADIQHPKLPFRLNVKAYFPNSQLGMRGPDTPALPLTADQGVGQRAFARPAPVSYSDRNPNVPSAYVELIGPQGSLGTWLVSTALGSPQSFLFEGKTWKIVLRTERLYLPFSLELLKVTHEVYPGSEIPRNFASRVRVKDPAAKLDHEVQISMNNPMREAGLTFYQYQMNAANGNSVFQVVRNPGWLVPYIACVLMGLGLGWHFLLSLTRFLTRPLPAAQPPSSES
ncbi:cytochrome c biogenesis protein ResB [Nibricoccus sp. IMCC34717]|uniref:cytochrome c biogenesis protein ResB n=1 Tax=Nibricoccus sp. IMCC34717 TaxID=3034021 RepID=UPI00384B06C8